MNSGSNKKIASRKLGSSFQKAHATSTKMFRRRISLAWARVGALESGFTVEPWPTMRSPLWPFEIMLSEKTSNDEPAFARLRRGRHPTSNSELRADVAAGNSPPGSAAEKSNNFLEPLLQRHLPQVRGKFDRAHGVFSAANSWKRGSFRI